MNIQGLSGLDNTGQTIFALLEFGIPTILGTAGRQVIAGVITAEVSAGAGAAVAGSAWIATGIGAAIGAAILGI